MSVELRCPCCKARLVVAENSVLSADSIECRQCGAKSPLPRNFHWGFAGPLGPRWAYILIAGLVLIFVCYLFWEFAYIAFGFDAAPLME